MGRRGYETVTSETGLETAGVEIVDGTGATERSGSPPFDDLGPCRQYLLRRGRGGMVGETLPLELVSGLSGVSVGKRCGRQGGPSWLARP